MLRLIGLLMLSPFIIFGVMALAYFIVTDIGAVLVAIVLAAWAYAGLRLLEG